MSQAIPFSRFEPGDQLLRDAFTVHIVARNLSETSTVQHHLSITARIMARNILATDEAAVEEGQPRRHQHDQAGAEQHESRASSVDVQRGHDGFSFGGFLLKQAENYDWRSTRTA